MVIITLFLIPSLLAQPVNNKELKLEYKYPSDTPVKYFSVTKIDQNMDVNGQLMQVNISSSVGCQVKSAGKSGDNLKLVIQVDTMGQSINSPQGAMGGAFNDVAGKEFEMVISSSGKEVDLSGAKAVTYYSEGSGRGDLSGSFIDFFPDLPEVPVSAGFVWTSVDTVAYGDENASQKMVIKSENNIDGIEVKNGNAFVLIKSKIAGTFDMKAISQGMNVSTTGPLEGISEYIFSVTDGYFLRQSTTSTVNGIVRINMGDIMEFPVEMKITSVNEVQTR